MNYPKWTYSVRTKAVQLGFSPSNPTPTNPAMEQMIYGRRAARSVRAFASKLFPGQFTGRLIAFVAALTCAVALEAQSTGAVHGRVYNIGSGRYLNNAKVTVEGTNITVFSNEFGEYRVDNLPVGEARLQAEYTGLDTETITVNVTAGAPVSLDFNLTSRSRYGEDKTIVLDTFTVAASREFEGNAIATNEQRYAPNVKVVMAADAFGDVTEGNAGEFLKYLPGVTVDYVAADVRTVSVRGFAAQFTNVYLDGMRTTSSASGASGRIFEFEQVSINNASRVEVIKVPTPDTPADALGGSVNLVSKNAFEQKGASFNYRAYLSFNSETAGEIFQKSPGPGNKDTYKVLPGFDFTYTLPFSDRFGIVVTGLSSNQFNEQHRWQPTWNYAQGGATPTNPYLQQWQLQDGPKNTFRDSFSVKADWKISDNQTLSVMVQDSYYKAFFGNRNINFNMGTTTTASSATGTPLQWSQTFVQSATGRASVTRGSSFRDKLGNTAAGNIKYRFDGRDWNVDANAFYAKSRTWYRAIARGQFSNVGSSMVGVGTVRADNIAFPDLDWTVRDAAGNQLNPYLLGNYRVTTAQDDPVDGKAVMKGANLDIERELATSFPLAVKVGVSVREEDRDNRRYQSQWTMVGADGLAGTADDAATPFLDTRYGVDPYWGEPNIQWLDPYKLYDHFKANPTHFVLATGAANVTNSQRWGAQSETFRINNSEKITERISSAYLQLDGKLFDNKLQFVGGVRFEKTQDKGEGVLFNPDNIWQRNADGTYVDGNATTAGVQRVLKTGASSDTATLAYVQFTRMERGYKTDREYDGIYPSLHLTYNLTDNLLARFAYAKTLGRPDYSNIIPNTSIDENDTDPNQPGTITIRNTGLKPWEGDNYDVSLEYYPDKGGVYSVGAFVKELDGFWVSRTGTVDAALADELGIDQEYVGWGVSTTINGGAARISGAEFNAVRTLDFMPGLARHITLSANGTLLHLEGQRGTDFRGFIPKAGNFSISWNKKPISARVTWNYRGRQRNAPQTGAQYGATGNFYEYYDSRYNIDVNAEYTFSKRYKLFFNARNILNKTQTLERYNEVSARSAVGFRAEDFGVQFAVGVRGTW